MIDLNAVSLCEFKCQFSGWCFDSSDGSLVKDGQNIRLQPRIAKLLHVLVSYPNEVLSREFLINQLWGDKAINEDALSRCIAELRSTLGDKSQNPTFIQTVPKKGYRFIDSVELIQPEGADNVTSDRTHSIENQTGEDTEGKISAKLETKAETKKHHALAETVSQNANVIGSKADSSDINQKAGKINPSVLLGLLFVFVVIGAGIYSLFFLEKADASFELPLKTAIANSLRLTLDSEVEFQPEISAQGDMVAYIVRKENRYIVRIIGVNGQLLHEVTDPTAHLLSPTFHPSGKSMMIAALAKGTCEMFEVSLPRLERKRLGNCSAKNISGLFDWSSDGRYLAYVNESKISDTANEEYQNSKESQEGKSNQSKGTKSASNRLPSAIWIKDLHLDIDKQVTFPKAKQEFDTRPKFSPDGNQIAFTRGTNSIRNIFLLNSLAAAMEVNELESDLHVHQQTSDSGFITSLTWMKDNRSIVFDSNKLGDRALWLLETDTKKQIILGARDAQYPDIDLENNALIYKEVNYNANIWQTAIETELQQAHSESDTSQQAYNSGSKATPLISAIKYNNFPRYSPDGASIAFISNRKGRPSLWLYDLASKQQKELLAIADLDITSPNWSVDGSRIIFSSRGNAGYRCYEFNMQQKSYEELAPSQQALYGCIEASDGFIYAVVKEQDLTSRLLRFKRGGEVEYLTDYSVNRTYPFAQYTVVFTRPDLEGLFQYDLRTKQASVIVEGYKYRDDGGWLVKDQYVYYINTVGEKSGVWRYNLRTAKREWISKHLPSAIGLSLAISPDHKNLLFVQTDSEEGNIYITRVN